MASIDFVDTMSESGFKVDAPKAGEVIVDNGEFVGVPGRGEFLLRGTNSLLPEGTGGG